jgi:flagellar basal-body rod protein FlgB
MARRLLQGVSVKTLFDGVDRMEGAMTFHRERHSVLAGNVANVDTPGYRPLDLEQTAAGEAGVGAMAATAPGHMQAGSAGGLAGATLAFTDDGPAGADGNAVTLERELAKIDANRVRYSATSELATRRLALLRYAATDGQG